MSLAEMRSAARTAVSRGEAELKAVSVLRTGLCYDSLYVLWGRSDGCL